MKSDIEKPIRTQGRNANQIKHFNTQQSFREYQPKQKEVNQLKKKKQYESKDIHKNKNLYQNQPLEFDSYPTFNQNDSLFMNVEELPSQVIAKELRTKSVENNRKTKRSRMGNYLQGVPNNKQNKSNYIYFNIF